MVYDLNDSNFESLIANSKQPVILDFWAEWCGPCKLFAPVVDSIAKDFEGQVTVLKCNVDDCNGAVSKYKIRNIPTVLILVDGEVIDRQNELCTKNKLVDKINTILETGEAKVYTE